MTDRKTMTYQQLSHYHEGEWNLAEIQGKVIMVHTVTAVFDGNVLHPDTPLDLKPGTRYTLTIQPDSVASVEGDAWEVLETLTGTVDAPPDWASEHDHYLYGTAKHQPRE